MSEAREILKEMQSNSTVQSVVFISGKPGSFIAGADVTMIQKVKDEQEAYQIAKGGQEIFETIANSKKPVVAAIQGACLGGGLEVNILNNLQSRLLSIRIGNLS